MTVVFLDLDGTLTDAGPGIVGPPLWDTFERLGVARENLDHAVALYRERYIDIGWSENSLYDGILEQLSALKDEGYTLCIATSKPQSYAKKITTHFEISQYMSHEFGSELDGTCSDKTSLLAHGLELADASSENSLMVGDRSYDIIGAKSNGIKVIGVSYGYGGDAELSDAGADFIISNVTELSSAVCALLPLKDT